MYTLVRVIIVNTTTTAVRIKSNISILIGCSMKNISGESESKAK